MSLPMEIAVLGIDLGKNNCSLVALDRTGAVVKRRPDSAAKRVDGGPQGGAQQRPAPVLLDLDLTEVGEVADDMLPFRQAEAARCETVHQLLTQYQSASPPSARSPRANGPMVKSACFQIRRSLAASSAMIFMT